MGFTMPDSTNKAHSRATYRIGAVANITGLSTHSIRAWERRYDLKLGQRSSGGTRSYTDKDVVLLSLLKALTDQGHAISEVAQLPEYELRERLRKHETAQGRVNGTAIPTSWIDFDRFAKAIVLGDDLADYLERGVTAGDRWQTCWKFDDMEALWNGLDKTSPDVLLTRLKTLGPDPHAFLDRWNEQAKDVLVIVFYEFNKSSMLTSLSGRGVKLMRWPVDAGSFSQHIPDFCLLHRLRHLQQNQEDDTVADAGDRPLDRLFTDTQLMDLKLASSKIDCECPNHLASLVFELNAFEAYSRNCVGDDEAAALHMKLAEQTAQLRASMERMLLEVCRHENLKF